MSGARSLQAETLAKAAVRFCQHTHHTFPDVVIEAVDDHYSDEDLTVEVHVPARLDRQQVADELIRIALKVEDAYGVTILTRAVPAQQA